MTTRSAQSRELELKLAVPAQSVKALAQHPALRGARAQRRHEVSTYFDTSDLALDQQGLILRVRRTGSKWVQTLKADARHRVAFDRAEWEWLLGNDQPDLALLATTPVAGQLPSGLQLEPVFVTDINRTIHVFGSDGTVTEVALDEGAIIAGERRQAVCELELELRKGDPSELYRLGIMLHENTPFAIAAESKAARGYRLKTGEPPTARKSDAVVLQANATAAEAFQQIVAAGLGHLVMNQPAGLAGDAEGIHQMRVAIRRLRATLLLFKPHLEPHARTQFEAALHRLGRIFGDARDWDVFCLQILPAMDDAAGAATWRDLLETPAMARRETAHRHFVQELRAPTLTSLVLGLAAWAEQGHATPGLLGGEELQQPIEHLCPQLLDRLAHKVTKRGRHIDRSDDDRHALRKSLKKLRYAIGCVQSLFPGKSTKPYLRACKKLQSLLGDINDTVAATALADSLADETHPERAPSIGALARSLDQRRTRALHDLPERWRAFQAEPEFWQR
jgi:inorganic triphosphatase YgiF